jgi:hypothetical protein
LKESSEQFKKLIESWSCADGKRHLQCCFCSESPRKEVGNHRKVGLHFPAHAIVLQCPTLNLFVVPFLSSCNGRFCNTHFKPGTRRCHSCCRTYILFLEQNDSVPTYSRVHEIWYLCPHMPGRGETSHIAIVLNIMRSMNKIENAECCTTTRMFPCVHFNRLLLTRCACFSSPLRALVTQAAAFLVAPTMHWYINISVLTSCKHIQNNRIRLLLPGKEVMKRRFEQCYEMD